MPIPQLPADLPNQFDPGVAGRTLILDGDFPAYAVAATVKTMPTAIRHFQRKVLEYAFMAGAEDVSVHLTSPHCDKAGRWRINGVKPYQGNRVGKAKPALLEGLRQAMAMPENWLPEFRVQLHYELEADDGIMIESHTRKDSGVVRSEDKDLRMTPYPWYDIERGQVLAGVGFGHTELAHTPSGVNKGIGQGRKFFWLQMLMGDAADNVQGLLTFNGKTVGPVTACSLLASINDEDECANAVVDCYRSINQNPLPEAALLWILRHPMETVTHYLQSISWSPENAAFLMECFTRKWYDTTATASTAADSDGPDAEA